MDFYRALLLDVDGFVVQFLTGACNVLYFQQFLMILQQQLSKRKYPPIGGMIIYKTTYCYADIYFVISDSSKVWFEAVFFVFNRHCMLLNVRSPSISFKVLPEKCVKIRWDLAAKSGMRANV